MMTQTDSIRSDRDRKMISEKCSRDRCKNKPHYKVDLLLPLYMERVQFYCYKHLHEGFKNNKNFIITELELDEVEEK